jgi:hypothetical protein
MKKLFTLFTIIALATFSLDAYAQPCKGKVTTVGGPMLSPDKTEFNYGTIKKASDGNCVFTICNTGDQDLVIANCQGSCGCTTPKCDSAPIPSGSFYELKVHYDTMRLGAFTKTVSVTWKNGAGEMQTTVLTIRGEVIE